MRKFALVLLVLWASASPASAKFIWQKINVCPWDGTDEQGVLAIAKHFGFSEETRRALFEKIRAGKPDAEGELKNGSQVNAMLFCGGRIVTQVVASWTDGTESVRTKDYTVKSQDGRFSYTVRKPVTRLPQNDDACKNWFLQSIDFHILKSEPPAQPAAAPAPTPQPEVVTAPPTAPSEGVPPPPARQEAVTSEPGKWRILRINFWSLAASSAEGREILGRLTSGVAGRQSRDLNSEILAAAAAGKIARNAERETFKLEFHDADFAKAPGSRIIVSGETKTMPVDFRPGQTLEIPVRGSGYFATPINPPWNNEHIAAVVYSPFLNLPYPFHGSLKTCGPATALTCGGGYDPARPTRLFERLKTSGYTDFHFVK